MNKLIQYVDRFLFLHNLLLIHVWKDYQILSPKTMEKIILSFHNDSLWSHFWQFKEIDV